MEFPPDVFKHILTFFPTWYRNPCHVIAINTDPLFADFTIYRLQTSDSEIIYYWDILWINSFIQYKKIREFQ